MRMPFRYIRPISCLCDTNDCDEDQPNENKQRTFVHSFLLQRSQPPALCFGRDSKAGRGAGELYSGTKQSLLCPDRGCWPGEAEGGLTRSGAFYVTGQGVHV